MGWLCHGDATRQGLHALLKVLKSGWPRWCKRQARHEILTVMIRQKIHWADAQHILDDVFHFEATFACISKKWKIQPDESKLLISFVKDLENKFGITLWTTSTACNDSIRTTGARDMPQILDIDLASLGVETQEGMPRWWQQRLNVWISCLMCCILAFLDYAKFQLLATRIMQHHKRRLWWTIQKLLPRSNHRI